jgi:hypothetical protein
MSALPETDTFGSPGSPGAVFTDEEYVEPEDPEEEDEEFGIDQYDLTSTPNDFNVKTIIDFIDQGVFIVPAFQRNYVWEIRRASKLIESIIIGLPIPQIFLYEEKRNRFLVIDGQQRLMSVYYYVNKRFPRVDKRSALRRIFDEKGSIPREVLANDTYFTNFNLSLPSKLPHQKNPLHKLNYDTLSEYRTTFELRTIRCVIIKQNTPKEDDSSVYEIFNRLNTGGVNLTPQEIRTSLYHSEFYKLLYRLNADPRWRAILGSPEPDLRMKDIEILLRGFAMLIRGDAYTPSMTRFLNQFSKDMGQAETGELWKLENVYNRFLQGCQVLPRGIFGTRTRKLNISVFESVFAAACLPAYSSMTDIATFDEGRISRLKNDSEFLDAASTKSTNKTKVALRLQKAREFLLGG